MTKKIITTATLIVASVAIANAAVVDPTIKWEDFSILPDSISATTSTANTSGDSTIKEFPAYFPTESGTNLSFSNDVIFVRSSSDGTLDYAANTGTFTVTVSNVNLGAIASGELDVLFSVGLSSSNQIGVGLNSSGAIVATTGSTGDIYGSASSTVLSSAQWQAQNTLSLVLNGSGGALVYLNGNLVNQWSGLQYSSSTVQQLAVGGTTTPNKTTEFTLENIYIHNTSLTGTQIAETFNSAGLIPEPSMFGLLAGLGALALVGTRRRRK